MPAAGISRFRESLPAGLSRVVSDQGAASYGVAGKLPSLVARPDTPEQITELVRAANASASAIVPWGGGLHMSLGNQPLRYDVAIDLRKLNRLVEYEPADLTVTVESGMTLAELQSLLAPNNQRLNLDPAGCGAATIGGLLAANASGPSRLAFGTARDLLIGIRVVTPRGNEVKAGGRVVKNVAGYDLGKLHIGALGSLGIIVQATFKLHPLPSERRLWQAEGSLETLLALSKQILQAQLTVTALVLTRGAGEPAWRLNICFEAGVAALDRSEAEMKALAGGLSLRTEEIDEAAWQTGLTSAAPLTSDSTVGVRLVSQQSHLASLLSAAQATDASIASYPASGIAHLRWQTSRVGLDDIMRLRSQCEVSPFGALIMESASTEWQDRFDAWGATRGDFILMQRLKDEVDPNRVLSPGRYLGGL